MKAKRRYWLATLLRGIVALIAGSAILSIPDMARTILLLPIAVVTSILILALYGVLDSIIILYSSYTVPWRLSKLALRLQGLTGIAIGCVLLSAIFGRVQLQWFLYFATAQILATAVAEFVIARHSSSRAIFVWNYAAAAVAFVCGASYWFVAIEFGSYLVPQEIAKLIFGYLFAFGLAQSVSSVRMLYALSKGPQFVRGQIAEEAVSMSCSKG